MRAVEIQSKTDAEGKLHIDYQLDKTETKVRVLILVDEEKDEEVGDDEWLASIVKNPAFDFLNDEAEDIYTSEDGENL